MLVISTEPSDRLEGLELLEDVQVARRTWTSADLAGAFLVIAHDPDPSERVGCRRPRAVPEHWSM